MTQISDVKLKEMDTMVVKYCQVCGREAEKLCAACKSIYYCSVECQSSHWKKGHKKCCGMFVVADCECCLGGKHLEAAKDIDRGSIVLIEAPIFHSPLVMKTELQGSVLNKKNYLLCVTCSKNLAAGFPSIRCSRCRWPCCSKECEEHKSHSDFECEILASKKFDYESLKATDDVSLLLSLRCLKLKTNNPGLWTELVRCCPFQADKTERVNVRRMMKKVQVFDIEAFNVASTCVNSARGFCISDYDQQPCLKLNGKIGKPDKVNIFFFPHASYLSQSCAPNTAWWTTDFPDCRITVRSTRPIKAGEVLYIKSAVQNERRIANLDIVKDGTMARRLHIYNLTTRTCFCARCCDETEFGSYFSAMSCLPCQNELQLEKFKSNNNNNLGYFLLANPIPTDDDEMSIENRKNIPFKCNRCHLVKPYSHFALELSSFAAKLVSAEAETVSQLRELIEGNKTLHPNHFLLMHGKILLLELENKKFGDFSRFPNKIQRKNSRGKKIQFCKDVLNVDSKTLNDCWTSRRASVAAELADSLIKNYCQTLDDLDFNEVEALLAEVEEGIKLFGEAIFISKNIEPENEKLRNQVPEFLEKIKEGQNLKTEILNHLSQKYYGIETCIESIQIN